MQRNHLLHFCPLCKARLISIQDHFMDSLSSALSQMALFITRNDQCPYKEALQKFFSRINSRLLFMEHLFLVCLAVDRIFRFKKTITIFFFLFLVTHFNFEMELCLWDPKQLPVQLRNAHRLIEYYKPVYFLLLSGKKKKKKK